MVLLVSPSWIRYGKEYLGLGSTPSNEIQGGHKFSYIHAACVAARRNFSETPIPQEVIDCIDDIADAEHKLNGLTFGDRNGNIDPNTTASGTGFSGVNLEQHYQH